MINLLIAILGLCIGSFLNVAILRLPKSQSIIKPASYCPSCKNFLRWYHNIPLLSWLFLRGKCAYCKNPISIQYPLIEVSCGVLFYYFSTILEPYYAIVAGIIFSLMLAMSIIDYRYKAVPDALLLPALLFALAFRLELEALHDALLFAGGFALLRICISAFKKQESMGEADTVIAAIIGAVLGIKLGLVAIYIAALIALLAFVIIKKANYELPFIPFLSLGLFITYIFKEFLLKLIGVYFG